MPTANLQIAQFTANQNQKEVTNGQAIQQIDDVLTKTLDVTVTAGGVITLSSANFRNYRRFRLVGTPAGAFTFELPASIFRDFVVRNESGQSATIRQTNAPGATALLATAAEAIYYSDGAVSTPNVRTLSAGITTFLGLTDTPSSYSAQAGKIARVNSGETALEFVNLNNGANWAVPFKGALVKPTADLTGQNLTSTTTLSFGTQVHQNGHGGYKFWLGDNATVTFDDVNDGVVHTGHGMATGDGPFTFSNSGGALAAPLVAGTSYWAIKTSNDRYKLATSLANALAATAIDLTTAGSGTNTVIRNRRLVIPTGVTKVKVSAQVRLNNFGTAGAFIVEIPKNNTFGYDGTPSQRISGGGGGTLNSPAQGAFSGGLNVTAGDYFEVAVFLSGDTSVDIINTQTWFCIEVIETTDGAEPPEPVEFFQPGTPAATTLLYKKRATRAFALRDDFAGSVAHAEVAGVGATVFDVKRNGSAIGTVTFGAGSQTATFETTEATVENFAMGDRFEVHSQGTVDAALSGIAFAFWAYRT